MKISFDERLYIVAVLLGVALIFILGTVQLFCQSCLDFLFLH